MLEASRAASHSVRVAIESICVAICGSLGSSAMVEQRGSPPWRRKNHTSPTGAALARGTGERFLLSGGLRNARDALLIERQLPRDLLVGDAFDVAQAVDYEAGLDGVALKLVVLAERSKLLA